MKPVQASYGTMSSPPDSIDRRLDDKQIEAKIPVEAIVDDTNLFKRSDQRGATFDTSSLEEYYRPIDSFEGLHRYDPKYEWDPKDEKRLVRKVSSARALCLCLYCFE